MGAFERGFETASEPEDWRILKASTPEDRAKTRYVYEFTAVEGQGDCLRGVRGPNVAIIGEEGIPPLLHPSEGDPRKAQPFVLLKKVIDDSFIKV